MKFMKSIKWLLEFLLFSILFSISYCYSDTLPFTIMFTAMYLLLNIFFLRNRLSTLIKETQTNVELIEKHETSLLTLYNNQKELNKMKSKLNEILSKSRKKNFKYLDNEEEI